MKRRMRSIQTMSQILHSFIMGRKLVKRWCQACKQLLLNERMKPNLIRLIEAFLQRKKMPRISEVIFTEEFQLIRLSVAPPSWVVFFCFWFLSLYLQECFCLKVHLLHPVAFSIRPSPLEFHCICAICRLQ